jgi:Methyltransferase domain
MTPELINLAIERAIARKSKLTDEAMRVPMLGSLQIRHLLNNLGSLSSHYLEHGVHKGGSFCSTIFQNQLVTATAVDSFESDLTNKVDPAQPIFIENVDKFLHSGTTFKLFKSDSFLVKPEQIENKIDLYYFDGDHSYESQRKALTHFKDVMEDEFIYVVDDFMLDEVRTGTQDGIEEAGYQKLYERELVTASEYDNESWWRGFYVTLLKKN